MQPSARLTRVEDGVLALDCRGVVWAYAIVHGDRVALVDTGFAGDAKPILDVLVSEGISPGAVRAIVVTHCHSDHAGSLEELLERTGARSMAHRLDAPYVRGEVLPPDPVLTEAEKPIFEMVTRDVAAVPPTRIDHELEDGEEIDLGEAARVVHVPGHTPGSIAIHLPARRMLITGDAVANPSGVPTVGFFNIDRAAAIASFQRLAKIDFDVACFGHGPPLRSDAAAVFRREAASGDVG